MFQFPEYQLFEETIEKDIIFGPTNFGMSEEEAKERAGRAIEALPLDAIVLETDCPYMAPEPVRGTRCDSSLIRYVGEYIAQLRGISAEEVFRTTAENARRVYGL